MPINNRAVYLSDPNLRPTKTCPTDYNAKLRDPRCRKEMAENRTHLAPSPLGPGPGPIIPPVNPPVNPPGGNDNTGLIIGGVVGGLVATGAIAAASRAALMSAEGGMGYSRAAGSELEAALGDLGSDASAEEVASVRATFNTVPATSGTAEASAEGGIELTDMSAAEAAGTAEGADITEGTGTYFSSFLGGSGEGIELGAAASAGVTGEVTAAGEVALETSIAAAEGSAIAAESATALGAAEAAAVPEDLVTFGAASLAAAGIAAGIATGAAVGIKAGIDSSQRAAAIKNPSTTLMTPAQLTNAIGVLTNSPTPETASLLTALIASKTAGTPVSVGYTGANADGSKGNTLVVPQLSPSQLYSAGQSYLSNPNVYANSNPTVLAAMGLNSGLISGETGQKIYADGITSTEPTGTSLSYQAANQQLTAGVNNVINSIGGFIQGLTTPPANAAVASGAPGAPVAPAITSPSPPVPQTNAVQSITSFANFLN